MATGSQVVILRFARNDRLVWLVEDGGLWSRCGGYVVDWWRGWAWRGLVVSLPSGG